MPAFTLKIARNFVLKQYEEVRMVLDLIFPKRCVGCGKIGSYLCKRCFSQIEFVEKPVCPVCQRQAVEGRTHPGCMGKFGPDGLVVCCKYKGIVAKTIKKIKYRWVFDLERLLVDLAIGELWKYDLPKNIVLVPVPLHDGRKRWRGFNQSEKLATDLSGRFKVTSRELLLRIRKTQTQVNLKKEDRRKNVKGAFAAKEGSDFKGKNFLIVDDVYTTGATMLECCRVLKRAGAGKVWLFAIALG